MKKLETTLLLLKKENQILLAEKKRGFGKGKYNGVGGKLKEKETPEEAMLRETKEEIGIVPLNYHYVGVINFIETVNKEKTNVIMHLYKSEKWIGEIIETEEMRPKWFRTHSIPYDKMFPDDAYWMPYFLKNIDFDAYFEFDENWNIVSKKIIEKSINRE